MSYNVNDLFVARNSRAAGGDYEIERSVRFDKDNDASLTRTPSSAGNRKTWTWAGWVKLSDLSVAVGIFGCGSGSGVPRNAIRILQNNSDNTIEYRSFTDGTTLSTTVETTASFRDYSAWYHFVFVLDTTESTASDRFKVYVNGVRETSFSVSTFPGLNEDHPVNTTEEHYIGAGFQPTSNNLSGYLADVHFIDGQALDPTDFGEFDATTGVWNPIQYTGTFGTNGFHLDFEDNSTASALGNDVSGNNNDWTVNNISVAAGSGNDSLFDSPSNGTQTDTGAGGEVPGNYCTLNPLGPAGATPSNGNLSIASQSTVGNRISTFFLTSGKWYWEASGEGYVGAVIGADGAAFTGSISATGSNAIGYWRYGYIYWDGGSTAAASYLPTDIIGVALDMDAGNVKFYKNNTLIDTITFGSGTVPDLSSGVYPGYNNGAGTAYSVDFNFGQRPFAYSAPSGFKALCTSNLPTPTIADGSDYMDVALYTGTGVARSITGYEFSPDFVWLKRRSATSNHLLFDIIRGPEKVIESDTTDAEATVSGTLTAFNSDGFSLGTSSGGNNSGATWVAWAWDAGSSTVSNTDGSITSSVRANPSAGFSIVSYTGTGSAATVGHGLGVAPEMVIIKTRNAVREWVVGHQYLDTTAPWDYYLQLAQTAARTNLNLFQDTAPTSTVFYQNGGNAVGANGETHIAYCFAPVEGYSAFGSYTGNGSSDGPFVFTGFRPRYVLIKRTDTTENWVIQDTARSTKNIATEYLLANTSSAEGNSDILDILSNGFKQRNTFASNNASAGTYIYAAFAENPFSIARAR